MGKDLPILLGRNVQELRKRARLTQAELAERIDVSSEFLSRVERGLKSPSLETVDRIAKGLGVQVKDLLAEDPKPWGEQDKTMSELFALVAPIDAETLDVILKTASAIAKLSLRRDSR